MDELSVLDLQNLRHLIGGYETSHKKMMEYASGASDPQIKLRTGSRRSGCETVFPEICPVGHAEQTAAHAVFPLKEVFENDR